MTQVAHSIFILDPPIKILQIGDFSSFFREQERGSVLQTCSGLLKWSFISKMETDDPSRGRAFLGTAAQCVYLLLTYLFTLSLIYSSNNPRPGPIHIISAFLFPIHPLLRHRLLPLTPSRPNLVEKN